MELCLDPRSGASKQDEALELYARAGNMFKMAKKWGSAGNTFVTLAEHHIKLGNKHDAATAYVDAANCYKKSDSQGERREGKKTSWNPYPTDFGYC